MQKSRYLSLDHTGDLGVEVWGNSLTELLENASWALTDTIAEAAQIEPKIFVQWEVLGKSPEEFFVRQLEEILYQLDAKGLVFSSFAFTFSNETQILCKAQGEPLSRERHGFKTEIKAVTYHHLRVWKNDQGVYHATIIFDV